MANIWKFGLNEYGANNLPELVLQHGTRVEGAEKSRRQQQAETEPVTEKPQNTPTNKRQKLTPDNEAPQAPQPKSQDLEANDPSPSPLILPNLTLQSQEKEELPTDTEGVGQKIESKVIEGLVQSPPPIKLDKTTTPRRISPQRPSISVKIPSPTNYLLWQIPALK